MPAHVIALIDKPSRSSFSKHACVVQDEDGTLHLHGLRNHPRSTLRADELEQLVASQSVMRLPSAIAADELAGKVVGWLGRELQERLRQLDGPGVPGLPKELFETPDGDMWFEASERIYERMETWMKAAARDVFAGRSSNARELAELMLWVLPGRDETRAAVWYTRPDEAEKARHLAWYARLERDAGRPVEPAALELRFQAIRYTVRLQAYHDDLRRLVEQGRRLAEQTNEFLLTAEELDEPSLAELNDNLHRLAEQTDELRRLRNEHRASAAAGKATT